MYSMLIYMRYHRGVDISLVSDWRSPGLPEPQGTCRLTDDTQLGHLDRQGTCMGVDNSGIDLFSR